MYTSVYNNLCLISSLEMEKEIADILGVDVYNIKIPEGITSEEIYEDLTNGKWKTQELDTVKEWLTTGSILEFESLQSSRIVGPIFYYILKEQAREIYDKISPTLHTEASSTMTKLRLHTINVDLDAYIPKPTIRDISMKLYKYTRLLFHRNEECKNFRQLEYYDMHVLRQGAPVKLQDREVLLFRDVTRLSTLPYTYMKTREYPAPYPRYSFVVIDEPPKGASNIIQLYTAFQACKAMGIDTVCIRTDVVGDLDTGTPYGILGGTQILLTAWLAGLTSIMIDIDDIEFSVLEFYKDAATPRQFIDLCADRRGVESIDIEGLFDHKKMIAHRLDLMEYDLKLPPGVDVEELKRDVEIMSAVGDGKYVDALVDVLTGERLDTQVARELFLMATENDCPTINRILLSEQHLDPNEAMM